MAQAKKTTTTTKKPAAPSVAAVKEEPVVEYATKAPAAPAAPKWEYKDRLYELTGTKTPLVFVVPTKHSASKPLMYFDEELGYPREIRYATNQRSPFVDEQTGTATLGRIIFRDGILRVPKENVVLQQLLSLYHPYTTNGIIEEYAPEAIAEAEVNDIEMELEAMNMAKNMDVEDAEAIMRVELGSEVSRMSSKELKRDLLIFARNRPGLFLELANDDNIQLRNIGIKATEEGILRLSADQRTFTYGENGRKIMTVPFDEHPYSALAAYFKTDEGMEILSAIQKRL